MTFGFALLWGVFARDARESGPLERFNPIKVLIHLFKVHNVRILLFTGLLSFTITHGYQNWLPKILENAGMSPASAGFASALPLVGAIPAVLIIPRMVPQHMRAHVIALLSSFLGFSILWVISIDTALIGALLISGVCWACAFPLMLLILMDSPEVGSRYLGSATGILFCISEIGGFLGPFLAGFLVDFTGTFISGGIFFLVLGFVIAFLMFLLKPAAVVGKNQ
jgi:cyanate permease